MYSFKKQNYSIYEINIDLSYINDKIIKIKKNQWKLKKKNGEWEKGMKMKDCFEFLLWKQKHINLTP